MWHEFRRKWDWLFCRHRWEVVNKVNIYVEGKRMPVAKEYHVCCKKCGDVRKSKVKP